jgi:hypothetical protein
MSESTRVMDLSAGWALAWVRVGMLGQRSWLMSCRDRRDGWSGDDWDGEGKSKERDDSDETGDELHDGGYMLFDGPLCVFLLMRLYLRLR